jgi:hypothetical protein
VWLPAHRLLFGGCMVRAADASALGNLADADVAGWRHAIDTVSAAFGSAAIVVPGHGTPGGAELLAHTRELVDAAQ